MRVQRTALAVDGFRSCARAGCATVAPSPERLVSTDTSFSAGRAVQDFALRSARSARPSRRPWPTSK